MANPRVTEEDIQSMTGYKFACVLFAQQADLLVTEELAPNGDDTGKVSKDRLKLISLYLGCHFAALRAQDVAKGQNRIGESDERYHNVYKGGLSMTTWGQTACLIDSSNTLATLSSNIEGGAKLSARFGVVKTPVPKVC